MSGDERILAILEQIQTDIKDLKHGQTETNQRLGTLETKVDRLETKVDNLETKVDNLERDVAQIKEDVADLKVEVKYAWQDLGIVDGRLGRLEETV